MGKTLTTVSKEFAGEISSDPVLIIMWISWILSSAFSFVISQKWIETDQWVLFWLLVVTVFSTLYISKIWYFDKIIPRHYSSKVLLMRLWAVLAISMITTSAICSLVVLIFDGLENSPYTLPNPKYSFWSFIGKIFYDIIVPIGSFIEFKLIKKKVSEYNNMYGKAFYGYGWFQ